MYYSFFLVLVETPDIVFTSSEIFISLTTLEEFIAPGFLLSSCALSLSAPYSTLLHVSFFQGLCYHTRLFSYTIALTSTKNTSPYTAAKHWTAA